MSTTRKVVAALIAAGATLGAVAPATAAADHPMKKFTPQFEAPSAHDELKHPAPRDLANPPMAAQGTKTTQALVAFGAVRWNNRNGECYKAGRLDVYSNVSYRHLTFQRDGNLVAYFSALDKNKHAYDTRAGWATGTLGADRICFQADSNVVIYRGSKALWWSGKKLNMTGDRIRELAFGWPQLTAKQIELRSTGHVLAYWRLK